MDVVSGAFTGVVASISASFSARTDAENAALYALMSLSACFYTLIWFVPHRWVALSSMLGQDPCDSMAMVAHLFKLLQAVALGSVTDWQAARSLPAAWVAAAIVLFAAGQHLNIFVYARLGHTGVYYGARFGKSVPWVTGYPYSVMRDPQYIGAITSALGLAVFGPPDLMSFAICQYIYLICLEATPGTTLSSPAKSPSTSAKTKTRML